MTGSSPERTCVHTGHPQQLLQLRHIFTGHALSDLKRLIDCESHQGNQMQTYAKIIPYRNITINRSTTKILGYLMINTASFFIGVSLIRSGAFERDGQIGFILGWLGLFLFGGLGVLSLFMLLFGHRTPLKLSPEGFWYNLGFKKEIRWNEVSRLSVGSVGAHLSRTRFLRLELTEDALRFLNDTPGGRLRLKLDRLFRSKSLYVNASGLDTSFPELERLFRLYLAEHNPAALE